MTEARGQAAQKEEEIVHTRLDALELRMEQISSALNRGFAEMTESIRDFTSNNPASWSHGRSSLTTSPSSHHLEPGGGRRCPIQPFSGFSKLAKKEFVEVFPDPMAELKQLKETNGIVEYHGKFELISKGTNLSEAYLVRVFLAGLRSDTQSHIRWFQPQTVHQCLAIGRFYERAYPVVCCEENDTPTGSVDGKELVKPVLAASSASLMTKGVETLQPMIDIEAEEMDPNSSVKEMGSSAVKEVHVTDVSYEEESCPAQEKMPEMFHQIATFENKVPISFLESGYIDDPEVKMLAAESVQDIDHSVFEHSVEAYRINNLFGRAEFSQKRMGNMAVYVENSLSFPIELCAYKLLQESKVDEQRLLSKMLKSWHFKYKLQEQQYMKRQLTSRKVSSQAIALYMSTAEPTHQIQVEVLKHVWLQRRTRSLVPNSQSQSHSRLVFHVISSGIGSDVWVAHQNEKPYVLPVDKVNVLPLTSTAGIDKEIASQSFDKKVPQPEYLPTKKKQMECLKSWRFKFKHQPRKNKSCCMRNQLKYKNWKFKYKERTLLPFEAYLRKHRLHQKRKKLKGSQSWKSKSITTFVLFVLLCFPAVLIITLWSYVVWHGLGTASSSIWHRWRYKFGIACTLREFRDDELSGINAWLFFDHVVFVLKFCSSLFAWLKRFRILRPCGQGLLNGGDLIQGSRVDSCWVSVLGWNGYELGLVNPLSKRRRE